MLGVLIRMHGSGAQSKIVAHPRVVAAGRSMGIGDQVPSLPQLEILAYFLDVPVSHLGTETLQAERRRVDLRPST
jgi:hypothetical protein